MSPDMCWAMLHIYSYQFKWHHPFVYISFTYCSLRFCCQYAGHRCWFLTVYLLQLVMRICIYVLSDIFSPYFSLSGKMPSSIKTNIKSASGSMHPYNRWAPLFFFYSIIHHLFHFRDSPQETTFTTFVIFYMKPLFSWNCPTSTKLFLCSQSVSPTFLFSTSWSKTKSWNICVRLHVFILDKTSELQCLSH